VCARACAFVRGYASARVSDRVLDTRLLYGYEC
jgi:hypothetical protein